MRLRNARYRSMASAPKGSDMRWASTTCMTSPARMYSRILSTDSLNGSSPNSEVKSLSSTGWFVALSGMGGTGSLSVRARSRSRSMVRW